MLELLGHPKVLNRQRVDRTTYQNRDSNMTLQWSIGREDKPPWGVGGFLRSGLADGFDQIIECLV